MKKYIIKISDLLDWFILLVITFISEKINYKYIIQIMMILIGVGFIFSPEIVEAAVLLMLGFEYMYTKEVIDEAESTLSD